ncbi:GFA family protein [Pseudoteredinibacter isoporae]|uniref:GFA family protein n=1 Tax=Pseudoteredinibacter isoporae TaxID=570281 RepID=UPI003105DD30
MIKGHCNCESVRFEVEDSTQDVYMCHCSMCRRGTASGGIAVAIVPRDRFQWLSGEAHINTWHKPGHDWQTSFCDICGSNLPGPNDSNSLYIPVGLISEGAEQMTLRQHLYTDSKARWEPLSDEAEIHTTVGKR